MSRKCRNRHQNEVDEEIKEDDSRYKVQYNECSDQLFLQRIDDDGGGLGVTTDEERVLRGR